MKHPLTNRFLWLPVFCGAVLLLWACSEESLEGLPSNFGEAYVPDSEGFQTFYLVDKTTYRLNNTPVREQYQLREVVRESFIGEGGVPVREVYRYRRPSDGLQNWSLDSVWTMRKTENEFVKIEHNVPLLKMRFPLSEGKTWDGNAYNIYSEVPYRVENLGRSYNVGGLEFPDAVRIWQGEDSSLVSKSLGFEVYAEGVGVVHRRTEKLIYCNDPSSDCFGQKIIERGVVSEVRLFDFREE